MKPFKTNVVQQVVKKQKNIHGFKTPQDYFENFEAALLAKMEAEKLPKETGFTVPEGYFNELENKVLKRVSQDENETKVVSLFSKKRVLGIVAIAASIALIVTLFNKPQAASFEDLQATTIADYFSEGNSDINSNDLIALLDDETITTLTLETELTSEENIENYLMDALDDNTLLIE